LSFSSSCYYSGSGPGRPGTGRGERGIDYWQFPALVWKKEDTTVEVIWIGLAAFVGGIAAALLGWLESKVTFDRRKFGSSAVRALVAAIGLAAVYEYGDSITPIDLLLAFLGGAGVDVVGNRMAGAITSRMVR